MTDTRDRVSGFLRDALKIDVTQLDEDLLASGRLDSLGLVELLFFLEQQFGIRVDVGALELDNLRSVEAISRLVEASRR